MTKNSFLSRIGRNGRISFCTHSLSHNSKYHTYDLRTKCGMGYHAQYLIESMKLLASLGGEQYLHILKYSTNDPIIVQEQLLQFMGIGRKVADCIALFSLNQCTAIAVEQQLHSLLRYATSVTPSIYKTLSSSTIKKDKTLSFGCSTLLSGYTVFVVDNGQ